MSSHAASKIAIVCALKQELAAVKAGLSAQTQAAIPLVRAGIGPLAAARAAKELSAHKHSPRLIVSTGFCGGLSDTLKVGDIVLSHEIADADSGDVYASKFGGEQVKLFEAALLKAGVRAQTGRTVCSRKAVIKPEDKRALGLLCGAIAVDMESRALADHVDAKKTSVIVMRSVSDCADEELPAEVLDFLNEAGNPRIGKITRFVLKRPKNIAKLMSLSQRSNQASAALTAAWKILEASIQ